MSATYGGATNQNQNQNHKLAEIEVPQARQALDRLKQETAAELGLANYQGYLGNVPSRENGAVGGNMVRKMIRLAETQLNGGATGQGQ